MQRSHFLAATLVAAVVVSFQVPLIHAAPPRVFHSGTVPNDTRLGPLQGERGDFSFVPADSPAAWSKRAADVRQVMRVALGLWPMPTPTPLEAVVHGKIDCGDYTVEKVYFQSLPGFFVTGNLYRPVGKTGKRAAVLSPHGHFPGGRFIDAGTEATRRQIAQGAERFEEGGRSFMQSRCVQLARMGCVVFHYDKIGYGDSVQLPLDLVHRFSRSRVQFQQPPAAGFYSASAELWLANPMGLHTYNSIRAMDFLISLPDVDPRRIAVTGESGGGTQTFMLCAVDERPLVSVPVVIVSADRQGGCTCENISGLRIGTYNLEFTALHAPKPLLVISADDDTRTMPQRGFPELARHYGMLGAPANIAHAALLQYPHNFNYVSRAAMYHWLNKHLELGLEEPIVERDYERLPQERLTVWTAQHPRPEGGPAFEQKLLDLLQADARKQISQLAPRDAATLKSYREVVGTAWTTLLRGLPDDAKVRFEVRQTNDRGKHKELLGLCRYRTIESHQAELPLVWLIPDGSSHRVAIWLDESGKAGLYTEDGSLKPAVQTLLDAGIAVIGVDLLDQGEFLTDGKPRQRQRSLAGEEAFAGWTYCYNLPLFARRVHDILAVVELAGTGDAKMPARQIDLIGMRGAGHFAGAAAALAARGKIGRTAIDTGSFRFAALTDVYDADFVPGAARYDDLPGLLALAAPARLWLAGEGAEIPSLVRSAYNAADAADRVTTYSGPPAEAERAAIEWLLGGEQ